MCFKSYENQILCFSPRSQEVFWDPSFFKMEYLSKIFCGQNEENISDRLCIC